MRSINSGRLAATVSLFSLATAIAPGMALAQDASAQDGVATATAAAAVAQPQPENCANIQDEAQRQACAEAAEQVDPLANQGEAATLPTGGSATAEATPGGQGVIVVTGSRLRRDERTSADPLTVIDPSVEAREGDFETAEIIQSSPLAAGSTQITSTLSTNFVIDGGPGVQTVSLRGLGANRTLVLLNGRRAGPAGVRGAVSSFDLNVIPTDAIQSIDILKTGASSIYGSDAIAGVVNLITRKNLRGLEIRAFASAPENSGGEQYNVSATFGSNIGDRGYFMIGADRWHRNELERRDRSFFDCIEENVTNPEGDRVDPIDPRTGEPYCTNIFANVIGISNFSANFGGGSNLTRNGVAIGTIQFDEDGTLAEFIDPLTPPANPLQFGAPAGFFPVGANTPTMLALTNDYDRRVASDSVVPETDRFTLFGEAGYELTDTIDLYFEGLYNRRKTRADGSRQLFFPQFTGSSPLGIGPFHLPAAFCDGLTDQTQCDPFATGDPLNTEFSGAQLLQPVIYAPSDSTTDVKYYRGVVGARADLASLIPNGFADVYFQHSRSDGKFRRDIIFRDAIEFGVAQFRTDLCEGTETAIRGVPCIDIDYTDPRVLAGNFTPEERAFLFGVDGSDTLYKQNTLEAVVGGDIFELPAGPFKVAVGGQWRRDSINDVPGPVALAQNYWSSSTSGITAGFQRSLEAFGEVEIPLLKDLPMVQELTFSGAARVTSTYAERNDGDNDSDKGNWTYKLAGNWQTTDFLRLRATYGTSFRSPALFEQFLNNETGFQGQGIDPCRRLDIREVSDTVLANCASQGIPLNHPGVGTSAEVFARGNVGGLDPETSRAITASVIFTPKAWLWDGGQFSLTVDYIDIKVRDQVTQLGAATILQECYESPDFPDDPFCDLFVRDLDPDSPRAFEIITVENPYFNIDEQHNKSVDVTGRFRQDMGSWGTLSILGQASIQLKDEFTFFEGFEDEFNGEVGDPKWILDLNLTWSKKPFTITYGLDVIGATNDIKRVNEDFGTSVTENNCLLTAGGIRLRGGEYCPIYKLPRVAYHSISAEIQATDNFTFLLGVANLFDKKPPLVSTVGTAITPFHQVPLLASYYDYYGRRFFVSAKAKLGDIF